jgi:hypothetical protein
MRLPYYPTSYNDYLNYYAEQVGRGERNINVYRGAAIQRGNGIGSVFQSLIKFITPLFKSGIAKSAGKAILKRGINVGSDVLAGKSLGEAVKEQTGQAISSLLSGTGRRRRKRKSTISSAAKKSPRKRRKSSKRTGTKKKTTKRRRRRRRVTIGTVAKRKTRRKKATAYSPQMRLSSIFD